MPPDESDFVLRFEAELLVDGRLSATTRPGFTGSGYVRAWTAADGPLTATVVVGFPVRYRLRVRAVSTAGASVVVRVDGATTAVLAVAPSNPPEWSAADDHDLVLQLPFGIHSLSFEVHEGDSLDIDHVDVLSVGRLPTAVS